MQARAALGAQCSASAPTRVASGRGPRGRRRLPASSAPTRRRSSGGIAGTGGLGGGGGQAQGRVRPEELPRCPATEFGSARSRSATAAATSTRPELDPQGQELWEPGPRGRVQRLGRRTRRARLPERRRPRLRRCRRDKTSGDHPARCPATVRDLVRAGPVRQLDAPCRTLTRTPSASPPPGRSLQLEGRAPLQGPLRPT